MMRQVVFLGWVAVLMPVFAQTHMATAIGDLPVAFEPNVGQTDSQVRFLARTPGAIVFFTDSEAVMVIDRSEKDRSGRMRGRKAPANWQQEVVRMKLVGGETPQASGLEKLPGVSNYFIGQDPKKWRTDVPHYARIQYRGVYPGIDMICYGKGRQLEYDLVVAPGADPRQIELAWEGVERLDVNADGDLVLATRLGEIVEKRPRVYQEIGGRRVEVAASYLLRPHKRVAFELARYDRGSPLVIDPVMLVYSTYLGGTRRRRGGFHRGRLPGLGLFRGLDLLDRLPHPGGLPEPATEGGEATMLRDQALAGGQCAGLFDLPGRQWRPTRSRKLRWTAHSQLTSRGTPTRPTSPPRRPTRAP